MAKNKTIHVKGTEITVFQGGHSEFISLTDIARHKDAANTDSIIQNWLRNRNTIELLGFWELMYNRDCKHLCGARVSGGLCALAILVPWYRGAKHKSFMMAMALPVCSFKY